MDVDLKARAKPVYFRGRSPKQQRRHEEVKKVFGSVVPMFVAEIKQGNYVEAGRLLNEYVDGLDPRCVGAIRLATRWLADNDLTHA